MGSKPIRPALFTIPIHLPFLDTLVAGLRAETGNDALALSRVTILLPTRRACRALREAFLRASAGRPLLLPRMRPLGDLDDDELAVGPADAASEAGWFSNGAGAAALDRCCRARPQRCRLNLRGFSTKCTTREPTLPISRHSPRRTMPSIGSSCCNSSLC